MTYSINLLLPPRCVSCGENTENSHQLCATCWKSLEFITTPFCDRCGHPFVVDQPLLTCGDCLNHPPPFTKGRTVFRYDSLIRDLILRFKHADATYLAKPLGSWLARAGKEFLGRSEVIIPVPLHRWRLLKRRYNQATLLARELRNHSPIPLLTNVLVRSKKTEPQQGKSRQERQANVRAVFKIALEKNQLIKNKSVLLVDDVWTTGATLNSCVQTLKKAGAKEIFVLTLARVIKGR